MDIEPHTDRDVAIPSSLCVRKTTLYVCMVDVNFLSNIDGRVLQVAELVVKRPLIEAVILVRVLLFLLWTRLGTLFLCGSLSLSRQFPYVNSFSTISIDKREKILQSWLKNAVFIPIRLAIIYIKMICLYVYFSQVRRTLFFLVYREVS